MYAKSKAMATNQPGAKGQMYRTRFHSMVPYVQGANVAANNINSSTSRKRQRGRRKAHKGKQNTAKARATPKPEGRNRAV